jgi:hypothetical protein
MTLLCSTTLFSTACQESASTDDEAIESLESSPAEHLELAEEDAAAPSLFAVFTFTLDEGDTNEVNSAGFGGTKIKAKNSSNQAGEFCVQAGIAGEECVNVPAHTSQSITRWFAGLRVTITNVGDSPLKFTVTN